MANGRGTGPTANTMPNRRAMLERMPDRPAMVDTGSPRLGMQRQSPVVYRLSFSDIGVQMTDEKGNDLPPNAIKAVVGTILKAPNLREGQPRDDFGGRPAPIDDVSIDRFEEGPPIEAMQDLDRRPTVNYTEGRGIPSTRDAVMRTSPLETSPQFREGPEMRLAPRVEDVELPKLRRRRGGATKRKRHGGKIKKYAKGGGIRKPNYS